MPPELPKPNKPSSIPEWKVVETEDGIVNVYMAGPALGKINTNLSCIGTLLLSICFVLIVLTLVLAFKL